MSVEFRDHKNRSLRVLVIAKDSLDDLANHPGLVRCTVDIEDRDGLDELSCRDFVLANIVLVDEETDSAAIDKRRGATLDTRVGRLEINIDSEGAIAQGG